jgi:hypothetical protein
MIADLNATGLERSSNSAGIMVDFVPANPYMIVAVDEDNTSARPVGRLLQMGDNRHQAHDP